MKYIWIIMLIITDLIWWIATIKNIKDAIKEVKEHYICYSVFNSIDSVVGEMEGYATGCIALHLFVVFVTSLVMFLEAGGAE